MAPPTRTPRHIWIDEGLRALARGGPDAVRIDSLAQTLGVTRGGFYWHFGNRREFLEAMLEIWERRSVDEVLQLVEGKGGDARTKVRRAGATFSSDVLDVDHAVRDWARRDAVVAERLRRVDNGRIEYLRSLFRTFCSDPADVEARCMTAFSLVIGSRFIAADHGGLSRNEVLAQALERLLI
jgi:AcrR family transcriptional regulator